MCPRQSLDILLTPLGGPLAPKWDGVQPVENRFCELFGACFASKTLLWRNPSCTASGNSLLLFCFLFFCSPGQPAHNITNKRTSSPTFLTREPRGLIPIYGILGES